MVSKGRRRKKLEREVKIMMIAGSLSGLFVCFVTGVLLWLLTPSHIDRASEIGITEAAEASTELPPPPPKRTELPFGGRKVLPGYRYVALYGNPQFPGLGALGEQSLEEAMTRAEQLALAYQPYSTEPIIPTLEIITTVASAGLTENRDYSQEIPVEQVMSWANEAEKRSLYVVLDLQPGRSTFLEQAKQYEPVLREPHVGLALDPEWRLNTLADRHMSKVHWVSADEVNQTAEWLANLVKEHDLPQKIFMVHQFKLTMMPDRQNMKTDRTELAYVLHMDGHGELGSKINTWNTVKAGLPPNMHMGWKNFYDEDKPTPTPEQTMQQSPQPVLVSYQ